MKPIEVCNEGKVAGKKWMRRAKVGRTIDRLACQFQAGKRIAIKLNVLNYATP